MDLNRFIERNPYLYHLTDRVNYPNIIATRRILSTKDIVELSGMANGDNFLRSKRPDHTIINIQGIEYKIRDQQPISEVVLARSLTHNWQLGDFIAHLNRRVFFWPNLNRLNRHYTRYEGENPIILRFNSADILALHPEAEFCRLNSGATRCSSHWNGNAPERGPDTFQIAANYNLSHVTVAEVTIPNFCRIPNTFWTSGSPEGNWRRVNL